MHSHLPHLRGEPSDPRLLHLVLEEQKHLLLARCPATTMIQPVGSPARPCNCCPCPCPSAGETPHHAATSSATATPVTHTVRASMSICITHAERAEVAEHLAQQQGRARIVKDHELSRGVGGKQRRPSKAQRSCNHLTRTPDASGTEATSRKAVGRSLGMFEDGSRADKVLPPLVPTLFPLEAEGGRISLGGRWGNSTCLAALAAAARTSRRGWCSCHARPCPAWALGEGNHMGVRSREAQYVRQVDPKALPEVGAWRLHAEQQQSAYAWQGHASRSGCVRHDVSLAKELT